MEYKVLVNTINTCNVDNILKLDIVKPAKCIPIDFLRLFESWIPLSSILVYSQFRNSLSFIQKALIDELFILKKENNICYAKIKKDLGLIKPKEEILDKAIKKSQLFYKALIEKGGKEEFYQDEKEEINLSFHYLLLKEMFNPVHFPFSSSFNYLVVGDDEGRSIILAEILKSSNIVVADIDEEIPQGIKNMYPFIKTQVIDTRFERNKVEDKFDVIISYSLLNSSLTTLIDFWKAKIKNCGIVYFSWYPALQKNFDDEIKILDFIVRRGNFEITHRTPYFIRMIKRI